MRVFVLLFNARTENEGIHTLKVDDRDIVLLFESEDDATRYGILLEAQDFSSPTVEPFDAEEIEEFCRGAGYESKIVPAGTLEVPPEANLEETDWQKEQAEKEQEESDLPAPNPELDRIRRQLEGLL